MGVSIVLRVPNYSFGYAWSPYLTYIKYVRKTLVGDPIIG